MSAGELAFDRAATGGIAAWFGYYAGTHDASRATVYAAILVTLYAVVGIWIARRSPSPLPDQRDGA